MKSPQMDTCPPIPLGATEGVGTGVVLGPPPASGAMPQLMAGMPPPLPTAVELREDVHGQPLFNVAARNIQVEGCSLGDAHFVNVYVRNCSVAGGAFQGCTFKSCNIQGALHLYSCRFEDCQVSPNCVVTRPDKVKNTALNCRVV